jgi:predicted peroxiredoxin
MSGYLLIESRDPLEASDVRHHFYDLATGLARTGTPVTLFLVQNGVFPARPSAHTASLQTVARAGVEVLADEFSLRERGIDARRLAEGVRAAPIEVAIDRLAEGRKALWH